MYLPTSIEEIPPSRFGSGFVFYADQRLLSDVYGPKFYKVTDLFREFRAVGLGKVNTNTPGVLVVEHRNRERVGGFVGFRFLD